MDHPCILSKMEDQELSQQLSCPRESLLSNPQGMGNWPVSFRIQTLENDVLEQHFSQKQFSVKLPQAVYSQPQQDVIPHHKNPRRSHEATRVPAL